MTADRTKRYTARLDSHLPTLANDVARKAFLQAELEKWETRYNDFQRETADPRKPLPAGGPDAYDFVLTMTVIAARKAQYETVSL